VTCRKAALEKVGGIPTDYALQASFVFASPIIQADSSGVGLLPVSILIIRQPIFSNAIQIG
jgi:hypothetical protein